MNKDELTQVMRDITEQIDVVNWHLGGSTAICGSGKDVDLIVLCADKLRFGDMLHWDHCGPKSYSSEGMFDAYRDGKYNAILIDDPVVYRNWERATSLCTGLYEMTGYAGRDMRVLVHMVLINAEWRCD